MAVNSIILAMSDAGLSATQELPGGTWCHTPEYLKWRYGAGKARTVKLKQVDLADELLGIPLRKLTKAERVLLMAQLTEN